MRQVHLQRTTILTLALLIAGVLLGGALLVAPHRATPRALAAPVHIADLGRLPLAF